MKRLNKVLLIFTMGLMFTFTVTSQSYSQLAGVMNDLGTLGEQWLATLDWNSGRHHWPMGSYQAEFSAHQYPHVFAESLIKTEGGSPERDQYWYRYRGVDYKTEKLMIYKRQTPASIICDGLELAPPFTGEVDPSIDSDVQWFTKVHFWGGSPSGYLEIRSRSWVNQNHDDYNIKNEKITLSYDNDNDGVDEMPAAQPGPNGGINIMAAWGTNLSPSNRGFNAYRRGHGGLYRNIDWRECKYFPQTLSPNAPRSEIPISLSYSSGADSYWNWKRPFDQTGNKWSSGGKGTLKTSGQPVGPESGELTINNCEIISSFYAGSGLFYADKAVGDPTDATNMPIATGKTKAWGFLDGAPDLWTFITTEWDYREDSGETSSLYGTWNYPDPTRWSWGPIQQDQYWGPWEMNNGESINLVHFIAVGGQGEKRSREAGVEYMKWYRDGIGTFDNAAKAAFLEEGLDSLVQNVDRAYWNYSVRNYDIPDPLGPPNIKATSGPDKNTIEWGYSSADGFKDPDTGTDDFKEWRLYKKLGHVQVNHPSDNGFYPYELIGTFDKGTTKYEDTDVIRGQSYHYRVTALDDGSLNDGVIPGMSLESSLYSNSTLAAQIPFKPGEVTSDGVLIVPNPYSISSGVSNAMNYTGKTNDIHFVNLPAFCTLKIYTATGDLVQTIDHTSGSADEIWTNMRTASNQFPVTGVYILAVDNARDANNVQLPTKFFKFVIIR